MTVEEEYRYFAPRLLELAADGGLVWPDVEIVFGKLGRAGWRERPQREAVEAFLAAFWSRTLASFPSRLTVGEVLCSLGGTGADPTPHLAEWGRLAGEPQIRHLHELAARELVRHGGRPALADAFWDPRPPPTTGPSPGSPEARPPKPSARPSTGRTTRTWPTCSPRPTGS